MADWRLSLSNWESLTFLASAFLYPFGVCDVIVAGFAVIQRPAEQQKASPHQQLGCTSQNHQTKNEQIKANC